MARRTDGGNSVKMDSRPHPRDRRVEVLPWGLEDAGERPLTRHAYGIGCISTLNPETTSLIPTLHVPASLVETEQPRMIEFSQTSLLDEGFPLSKAVFQGG